MRRRSGELGTPGAETTPSADTTRERVRALVIELAPVTPAVVTPSSGLIADMGYDSLGLLELAAALEDAIAIPAMSVDDATGVDTLADVQELVVSMIGDRDG